MILTTLCNECNGSGEGSHDGSSCNACGGSGEISVNPMGDDEPALQLEPVMSDRDERKWESEHYAHLFCAPDER